MAGSANQVVYKNSSNIAAGSANLTFDGATLTASNASGAASFIANSTANTPYLRFDHSSSAKFTIGESSIVGGGAGFYDFYAVAGLGQRFFTNAVQAMTLETTGNLTLNSATGMFSAPIARIGTYTAFGSESLQVAKANGTGAVGSAYQFAINSKTAGNRAEMIMTDGASANAFISYLPSATAANDKLTVNLQGSDIVTIAGNKTVGIGTSSPDASFRLTITGASNGVTPAIYFADTVASPTNYVLGTNGDKNFWLYNSSTGNAMWTVTPAGNLGLGVTPSAWKSGLNVFQAGTDANGAYYSGGVDLNITSNVYFNSASANLYKYGGVYAAKYNQYNGNHNWYVTQSTVGADNPVTFTQAMTLNASGFLGIGQASPICYLDVYGSGAYTYARFYRNDEAGYGGRVGTGNTLHSAGAVRSLGLDGFSQISFGIAGAQVAQFDSSGNLGIGTSSQNERLRLNSSTAGQARMSISYADSTISYYGSYSGIVGAGNATDTFLSSANVLAFGSGGTTERMRIDTSGNVGIGTTSISPPNGKLFQVGGTSGIEFHAEVIGKYAKTTNAVGDIYLGQGINVGEAGMSLNSYGSIGNGAYTNLDNSSASGWSVMLAGSPDNGADWFKINRAPPTAGVPSFATLLTVTSGGNLLVGTTSLSQQTGKLEVWSSSASTTGLFKTTAGATTAWACDFWNADTAGNNLFIEFATETTYLARGSITYNRAGGLTVYNTTSDQRLKENIVNAPSALSKINSVQIRSFDWKETGNHVDFGVIAQELEQVAPEAVTQGEDKEDGSIKRAWGVDTSALVPTMIKAIQEQQALIESLTTRLTALENK